MAITIYDIADRAGVSIATVSRVFSGRSRVAESTRERVFAVARELGYKPNVSARSLARQSTRVVAAVVPMLTSYFFMEVIRGVQDRLSELDYDLLVYTSRTPEEIDDQLARAAQKGRADAIILCSTPLTEDRVRTLTASDLPVVLVDSEHPDFDSVSVNNREGGVQATDHLIARGYQRIAHLAPNPASVPGRERRRGYEEALRTAGRAVDEHLIATSTEVEQHGFTQASGYASMTKLLALDERPDAVFAASDAQALGAMRAIRESGLDVPGDIAVIGFDDLHMSTHAGLCTLSQPMYEMGRVGVDKLMQRIAEPEHPVSRTVFSARLIVRTTTGVCPGSASDFPDSDSPEPTASPKAAPLSGA